MRFLCAHGRHACEVVDILLCNAELYNSILTVSCGISAVQRFG